MLKHLLQFESLPKYLLAAVLIIIPLYPKFPLFNVPGTYVAVRLEDLLMAFLAVIVGLKIVSDPKKFFRDPVIRAILVFLAVGFASVVSAALVTKTAPLDLGLLHLARRLEYIIPFFAVVLLFRSRNKEEYLEFFIKILVIVGIVAFLYGYGQRHFRLPVIITQNAEYSRGTALFWIPGSHINSTFAGHYDLAAFEVLTLPILIASFFVLKGKFSKVFLFLATAGGFWLLINSVSRIAQVSYLLSAAVALLLIKKYKALVIVLLVSIILIATSSNLEARFKSIFKVIVRADENVQIILPSPTPVPVVEDRSTSIRLKVEWPRAIRALTKNPLLGTGYSSITLATDNDYLRLLGETGILGFLSFVLIFYKMGKEFIHSFPLNKHFSGVGLAFMGGIFGGLLGTFVMATFIDIFEASKFAILFWCLMGITLQMARSARNA